MAYPDGFTYVSGPYDLRRFVVASTATFVARNPVTISGARTIIESNTTRFYIAGIAQNDAANSIYGSEILVHVPTEQTVYAVKVPTGVAASALSAGFAYNIAKSNNYFRVDTSSQASACVMIVPRGDGSTINSADSTVYVQFLKDFLGPYASNQSSAN